MQKEMIQDQRQQQFHVTFEPKVSPKGNANDLKREIVIHIVKQSLAESDQAIIEMVNRSLHEKYRCEISDCYENPAYLIDVLKYVYDVAYHTVVDSIKKNLGQFVHESGIREFVEELEVTS